MTSMKTDKDLFVCRPRFMSILVSYKSEREKIPAARFAKTGKMMQHTKPCMAPVKRTGSVLAGNR